MRQTAIFWPMLAHVLLVYIVYLVMFKRRYLAVKSGEARISQYKVRSTEPTSSVTAANNLINQFELPVLFYALCLALFVTNGVNYLTLALMWLFIVTRYVHAWVHLDRNYVLHRSRAFFLGAGILLIAWIWFALHLLGLV
ncbi:MAPEG family protein [Mesorhizobium sp. CA14]|uniref:MAPEG family protein n=1 Tax=Mesorhizobium sp. CA14 TaxID=2876642 RepID=UPI001CCC0613|nr:MAPEG family protein [Mesorhizobium sp. CA14]MBZ9847434.1 MAPEG family protein [Mesorhizobium sp. CA14]